jgi:hypothetical protein
MIQADQGDGVNRVTVLSVRPQFGMPCFREGASATDSGLVQVCRRSITNYNVPNAFIRPPTIARSPADKARLLVGEDINGRNRLRLLRLQPLHEQRGRWRSDYQGLSD